MEKKRMRMRMEKTMKSARRYSGWEIPFDERRLVSSQETPSVGATSRKRA